MGGGAVGPVHTGGVCVLENPANPCRFRILRRLSFDENNVSLGAWYLDMVQDVINGCRWFSLQ